MIQSINPATNTLIKSYDIHSDIDVSSIINNMSEEFLIWRNTTSSERKSVLLKIAENLEKDSEIHATMISKEMGKPIRESRLEIEKCLWVIKYYAENSSEFLKKEHIETDYSESYIQYDPLGIILGIMPWNFPYWQVFRFIGPALMAGNICLLKHASNVSGCSLLIEKLVKDSCKFENIFNSLLITSSQVENIIKNKEVKAVSFTGSEVAGADVAMKAGKEIKKTVLELGGSDPFIVLEDADIKKAAQAGVVARFLNTGQSCIAAKRFIVDESVYDEFIDTVKEKIKNLKEGDPMKDDTQIGPLAKPEFVEEIDRLVQSSIKDGAKCLLGGKIKEGCYYSPTLLIDVTENMSVFKYETFGPVFCITKASDTKDAVRLANQSIYGLGGSVWTSDIKSAKILATKINTGALFINDMTKSDPRLPFGGINKSGFGIELSKYGIREFVNTKTIVIK